jgi:2-methylaconitate cis-trans-isomerase PrpF
MDLRVRLLFMNRLHEAIAGSGSISLAAASRVPGSVVAEVTAARRPGELRIGHPSGVTPTKVEARIEDGGDSGLRRPRIQPHRAPLDGGTAYSPSVGGDVRDDGAV